MTALTTRPPTASMIGAAECAASTITTSESSPINQMLLSTSHSPPSSANVPDVTTFFDQRPKAQKTVDELIDWLITRSDGHAAAFVRRETIRAAVNQDYVPFDNPISDGDEIAFFPPVTGG